MCLNRYYRQNIGKISAKTKVLDWKIKERLSKNALMYSKSFNWDKSADKFERVLEVVKDGQ